MAETLDPFSSWNSQIPDRKGPSAVKYHIFVKNHIFFPPRSIPSIRPKKYCWNTAGKLIISATKLIHLTSASQNVLRKVSSTLCTCYFMCTFNLKVLFFGNFLQIEGTHKVTYAWCRWHFSKDILAGRRKVNQFGCSDNQLPSSISAVLFGTNWLDGILRRGGNVILDKNVIFDSTGYGTAAYIFISWFYEMIDLLFWRFISRYIDADGGGDSAEAHTDGARPAR